MSEQHDKYLSCKKSLQDLIIRGNEHPYFLKTLIDEFDLQIDYIKNSLSLNRLNRQPNGMVEIKTKSFDFGFHPVIKRGRRYQLKGLTLFWYSDRKKDEYIIPLTVRDIELMDKNLDKEDEFIKNLYLYLKSFIDLVMIDLIEIKYEPVLKVKKDFDNRIHRWKYF